MKSGLDSIDRICLRVDDASARGWVDHLVARFEAASGVPVQVQKVPSREPVPRAFETLLMLEKVLSTSGEPWLAAPFKGLQDAPLCDEPEGDIAIVNLSDTAIEMPTERDLEVRFDGALGLLAAADAVMDGRSPLIQIEHAATGQSVASGVASLEAAGSTGEALTAIASRVATLIERALGGRNGSPEELAIGEAPRPITGRRVTRTVTKAIAVRAARLAYQLCFRTSHWRIGWRLTDRGVMERGDLSGPHWQVLADPGTHFYADPFPIERDGRRFIFFEDLDHRVGKGIISFVEIFEDGRTGPVVPVLEEPWHLSYPFLIEDGGSLFMVPESSNARTVPIYRCTRFPDQWERHGTLLTDIEAADATIVAYRGMQYMFCVTRNGIGGYSDTLAIFTAKDLFGDWRPHAGNPILVDPASARPAGAMIEKDGVLLRPVQDCRNGYGAQLGLARVTQLDGDGFAQTVDRVLRPDEHWPGRKLHTLNRAGALETIDGFVFRPKSDLMNRYVERRYEPTGGASATQV